MATWANNGEDQCTLDSTVLAKIDLFDQMNGGKELLKGLLEIFCRTTPDRLMALNLAAHAADPKKLRLGAHSLKSSCAYIGAYRLRELCLIVEEMCGSGDLSQADKLVEEMEAEYNRVRLELDGYMARQEKEAN